MKVENNGATKTTIPIDCNYLPRVDSQPQLPAQFGRTVSKSNKYTKIYSYSSLFHKVTLHPSNHNWHKSRSNQPCATCCIWWPRYGTGLAAFKLRQGGLQSMSAMITLVFWSLQAANGRLLLLLRLIKVNQHSKSLFAIPVSCSTCTSWIIIIFVTCNDWNF